MAKELEKTGMALVACKECGKEISKKAAICPHCGFKPKRTSTFTWIVAIFVAVPMLVAIFSGSSNTSSETQQQTSKTPEQIALEEKRDAAVQRATVGATTLKKAMRNPDSFKLESALVINGTDAVCYTYRAQNGFGGMNAGQAVLSADGTRFLNADMEGFTKLWNKECGGKSGQDVATAIRWFAL
jgi:RNA polymerase subunit RPABC4/transcription elongation factor Spt4